MTGTTGLGEPNATAIAFFVGFVLITLGITWWAARRTQDDGGVLRRRPLDHAAGRTASRSPATT